MYAKSAIALAALAGSAQAFNSHRHLHQAERRDVDVDWVTVYHTVYVTAGQPVSPPETNFVMDHAPAVTSTIAVPTTQAPPPPAPPAPATTMATSVKPKPQPKPEPKPQVESQPESQPEPQPKPKPENILSDLPIIGGGGDKPSSTPPPSTGSGPASKRGVAYNNGLLADLFGGTCQRCGWAFNWNGNPGLFNSKHMTYIPMLWGDIPVHTNTWDSDAQRGLNNGAKHLMSFNEPDNAGQANMSPSAAAAAHQKYFSKYADKAQIGSPSVTNSGNPNEGIDWLKQFMSACKAQGGCKVDFCTVHWYSQSQYANTLFDHLEDAHKACDGKPIWLTEFAPLDKENASSFLQEVMPKLESLDYLHAYSYFMVAPDSLLSTTSLLSALGNLYASL